MLKYIKINRFQTITCNETWNPQEILLILKSKIGDSSKSVLYNLIITIIND